MSPKSSLQGDLIDRIIDHPDLIGRQVGFNDLTPLHGEWIREMVAGEGDYTLQAHRGSYKSSCLAVAISLLLVLQPTRNIIFLRKTDSDVAEMMIRNGGTTHFVPPEKGNSNVKKESPEISSPGNQSHHGRSNPEDRKRKRRAALRCSEELLHHPHDKILLGFL